ncbi:MAG TPA: hypothetical protein VK207_11815 [Bacteroidales bacterium]|nr:hypothetical protein [Bacteroidales bacterium]
MMEQDSLKYDTIPERPLPQWLTKQKLGLNTWQPEKIVMKEDKSLQTSFIVTGAGILLIICILTVVVLRKKKRNI